jgi:hypothetical protein
VNLRSFVYREGQCFFLGYSIAIFWCVKAKCHKLVASLDLSTGDKFCFQGASFRLWYSSEYQHRHNDYDVSKNKHSSIAVSHDPGNDGIVHATELLGSNWCSNDKCANFFPDSFNDVNCRSTRPNSLCASIDSG